VPVGPHTNDSEVATTVDQELAALIWPVRPRLRQESNTIRVPFSNALAGLQSAELPRMKSNTAEPEKTLSSISDSPQVPLP
jgi:hypothetical protein